MKHFQEIQMITYGLGIFTNRSKDEQNSSVASAANIKIPIGLSKEDYYMLLDATSKIGGIYRYADMFNTTTWNYQDLVNTINAYFQAFSQKDMKFPTKRDITLNINKDLLNVLTSFRFYLDYMDKNLHDDFGKASELVASFRQHCSNEYDNNFSYRFVYQLRNYAQHKGLVVNSINFGRHLDEENRHQVRHHFKIYINRKDLLEDKKFKKDLKAELINFPEKIDVMEHFSKWMSSLTRIHIQITHKIIPTGLEDAKLIKSYASKLNYNSNDDRGVPIISAIDHTIEGIKQIKNPILVPLPIEDAQKIIDYCQEIRGDPHNI